MSFERNTAIVDLFGRAHARNVLAAFGRAFGRLPENSGAMSHEQNEFLDRSVEDLAQDGTVICVRLSLFAEMMKARSWNPASLREVGGTAGVGVAFMEETFSSPTAHPLCRFHQKAARAVLYALLPEYGSDIKGNMRSYAELLEATGYVNRPSEFDQLIRFLDSDIRLITPTDPEGADDALAKTASGQRYYQLTHDYLVPSLRDWLTRKQRESRQGRAEILLSERTSLWSSKPQNRHLPTLSEHFGIRLLTDPQKRSESERRMLAQAARVHGSRVGLALTAMLLLIAVGVFLIHRIKRQRDADAAVALVDQIILANPSLLSGVIDRLGTERYRDLAGPVLKSRLEEAREQKDTVAILPLRLALLDSQNDASQVEPLREALLTATPSQFPVIRDLLGKGHREAVVEPLWSAAMAESAGGPNTDTSHDSQRFQASCALATYAADDSRWETLAPFVAQYLVRLPAADLVAWRLALQPARKSLQVPLARIFEASAVDSLSRQFAADTLVDFARDDGAVLAEAMLEADSKTFEPLLVAAKDQKAAIARLNQELKTVPEPNWSEDEKDVLARRQSHAGVALARLGQPGVVWHRLAFNPDPRLRTELLHDLADYQVDLQLIVDRHASEQDVSTRRALLLALGQFPAQQLPLDRRSALIAKLLVDYENEPDAGLHGAIEWLLRKWDRGDDVRRIVDLLKPADQASQGHRAVGDRHWYLNQQSQTFVVFPAREFVMGSPESEPQRQFDERQHRRQIERSFALAATEVTRVQYLAFVKATGVRDPTNRYVTTPDSPQTGVEWFEAARYCNWLSEQEGIDREQWCYEPNDKGDFGPGMKTAEGFLDLVGYRLPTEAEWEYACRAGAASSRYFGDSVARLPEFAWFLTNSEDRTQPVGQKKPNDAGLFDMLGNAVEWCHDAVNGYPVSQGPVSTLTDTSASMDASRSRVLRGGWFNGLPTYVRSACRNAHLPDTRLEATGFRPARTYR
ncbi:MAG: formylglycine-generating enzyme family protein [Planctomycetota bacterium]|nr:formylglycine-generating enzyme family protein [Planctomycetota bacterium]